MRIIGGNFKGKKILDPQDKKTRPLKDLTKESIFNVLKHSNKFSINIENSIIFRNNFNTYDFKLNLLISSHGNWDVNVISNPIKVDCKKTLLLRPNNGLDVDNLSLALFKITNKFEITNSVNKETLYWHLNTGYVKIEYLLDDKINNLTLLPIQLLILERFEDEE